MRPAVVADSIAMQLARYGRNPGPSLKNGFDFGRMHAVSSRIFRARCSFREQEKARFSAGFSFASKPR
jgi:hypothetical protein